MKSTSRRWYIKPAFLVWTVLTATLAAVIFATNSSHTQIRTASDAGRNDSTAQLASGRTVQKSSAFENYDIRIDNSKDARALVASYNQQLPRRQRVKIAGALEAFGNAEADLRQDVPGLRVDPNPVTGAPEIVEVASAGPNFLTKPSKREHETIVRRFLQDNDSLFGLTRAQVDQLELVAAYTNPEGNLSWVEFEQRIHGLPVFQGYSRGAITREGALARLTGNLVAGLEYERLSPIPAMTAQGAVQAAAKAIGVAVDRSAIAVKSSSSQGQLSILSKGPFAEDVKAELLYFPLAPGVVVLSYSMVLWEETSAYYVVVEADSGRLLWRKNIVDEQTQSATYRVYNDDSPSPLSPTPVLPGSGTQGVGISRTSFTLISELPAFDNLGWITDNGNTTTGNNVDAGLDIDGSNGIDDAGRAVGSPHRVFDFAFVPGGQPGEEAPTSDNYRMGSVTNLFFWSNRYHDRLYQLGFTEAARNFQNDNFGRGGLAGDFVRAEAQDAQGTNNAIFATAPDGTMPRMQMFIFTLRDPDRDSALDQDVVIHELTHGTSERLHANASGLTSITSLGLGEGWSDFYSRALLSTADEDINGVYALGAYLSSGSNNYYYGGRRFPYAVKTNVGANGKPHNPLTFADIDPGQTNLSDGAFAPAFNLPAFETHSTGEVWCMALLEVRARMITRLGFATGNQRALQIVTDGMKLDPASPDFLQARDSIIAADRAGFGGDDEADIWAGFAARGMGFSARQKFPSVVEAFDTPNLVLEAVTFSDSGGNNNGNADPGETLSLTVPINNPLLTRNAENTTASIGGAGSANYGTIPHEATVTRNISYTVPADAVCDRLTIPIMINSSLGSVTRDFVVRLGQPVVFSETFDGVTPPALPAGWTTAQNGAGLDWVTSTTTPSSPPNDAFGPDAISSGSTDLITPVIPITSSSAQISFRNLYNLETSRDGMILEISESGINSGAFRDITLAGGSFVSGEYGGLIVSGQLAGRAAWTGLSAGTFNEPEYITTVVNLPASSNGRNIRLRFRIVCDPSGVAPGVGGVRLDTITLIRGSTCAALAWQPVVLTAQQISQISAWTVAGRTYVYVKPQFPDAGYRVVDWGQVGRSGSDFTVDASVEKLTGSSIQSVVTTAQIYDLGPLADGTYNFNFKTSGTLAETLQFTVSSATPPPNPIDNAREFVRQQYRDFLNREADPAGEDFWTDNITKCSDPARRPLIGQTRQTEAECTLRQRETTSGAFFLSPEFQYTGYFVYRMYQGALGRQPKLSEFTPDAQFVGNGIIVGGQLSGAKINQNKADYAAQFVNCTDPAKYRCSEFKAIYDALNNQRYVDRLFQRTGINAGDPERAALVNGLNGGTETRASVLQKVVDGINVISEGNQQFTTIYGQAFYHSEFNRAFVLLEYFGYLRRDPDAAGYAFWLDKLNQFGGDFVEAEMVLAFISSPEYRARFGQP